MIENTISSNFTKKKKKIKKNKYKIILKKITSFYRNFQQTEGTGCNVLHTYTYDIVNIIT